MLININPPEIGWIHILEKESDHSTPATSKIQHNVAESEFANMLQKKTLKQLIRREAFFQRFIACSTNEPCLDVLIWHSRKKTSQLRILSVPFCIQPKPEFIVDVNQELMR